MGPQPEAASRELSVSVQQGRREMHGWGQLGNVQMRAVVIAISLLQPVGAVLAPVSIIAAWRAALTGATELPVWVSTVPELVALIFSSGFAVMILCQMRMRRHATLPREEVIFWRVLLAGAYPVTLPIYAIKYFR
jgi:hypothetical protein